MNTPGLLLILLCAHLTAGYNSSLFWSYYSRSEPENIGYSRYSPPVWEGGHLLTENEVEPVDNVLVLGSLNRISQGPRRKREVYKVYNYPGRLDSREETEQSVEDSATQVTDSDIQAFKSFLSKWPVKSHRSSSGSTTKVDYDEIYENHHRRFQEAQRSEEGRERPVGCRHSCSPGDGLKSPCCSPIQGLYSLGPPVQPSLLENWVTGVFEFAANNPVIFTFMKSLVVTGAVGVLALLWGFLGETVGAIELPRARYYEPQTDLKEEDRFLLEVVEGNWLSTLEEHVRRKGDRRAGPHYYCCVSGEPGDPQWLECFPHHSKTLKRQPTFQCRSDHKYDISLNLNRLAKSSTSNISL